MRKFFPVVANFRRGRGPSQILPLPRRLAFFTPLLLSSLVRAAGIVPDGTTATSVSVGGSGRQTVTIAAPVANGVSYNAYRDFNVSKSGADFVNTGVNARVIVNEVTSTNPSLIEGEITIVGPRANFILANPNGITVNGGKFVNTGTAAISTGKVSFYDFQPAPGFTQRNVILDTSIGQIAIGPEGLSGSFNNLELIAKQLKIDGKIENTFTNANAGIRIVAGNSHAEFDTSVSPTDGSSEFVRYSAPSTNNAGAITVDITPLGGLSAGRIQLIVTDQGAGVRHAGSALASAGDFVVSASGYLQIDGGKLEAARDVVVATPKTVAISRDDSPNVFIGGRNIEIQSNDIYFTGGSVKAGSDAVAGDITFGVADRNAIGATHFSGIEAANGYIPLTMTASGGIGVFAKGQAVTIDGAALTARQNVIVEAATIALGTQADNGTAPKAVPAVLRSETGAVQLTADGAVTSVGGLVDGGARVAVTGASLALKSISVNGELSKSRITSGGGPIDLALAGDVTLHASDVVAARSVNVDVANVIIEHDASGQGSVVAALEGAVTIYASGNLVNRGSLIQGSRNDGSNPASQGAVTLALGRNFLNESPDQRTLAAVFGQEHDVVIKAGGDVTNHAARIISNKGLIIDAQGDVSNIVDKTSGANGEQRTDFQSTHTELLFFTRSRSGFDLDYGSIPMPGQLAYLVADGDISIQGRNIANRGGEIDSNAGSAHFQARQKFLNEALASGEAHFERKCLIMCKTRADSNVSVTGGLISAAKDVTIDAGSEATNIGGRVLALNDLTITAPKVIAQGITGYSAIYRDRGMKTWFGDTWGQIYASDVGGSFTASQGSLTIDGMLYEDGGEAVGAAGTQITGGIIVIRPRHRDPVMISNHLGLQSWFGH